MVQMKTLTIKGKTYEIVDEYARQQLVAGGSGTPGGSTVSLYNVTLAPDGNGNYTSDKTVNEIVSAHNAGNVVRCNYTVADDVEATASIVQVLTVGGANCVLCSGVTAEGELAWIFIEPDGVTFVPYGSSSGSSGSNTGGTGTPGKSAYAYAKEAGYSGTETEFAQALAAGCKLPTVTTANNGAFLRVVNGAWSATTIANAEEVTF